MRRTVKNPDKAAIEAGLARAQSWAFYRGTPGQPLYPFPKTTVFRIVNFDSGYWKRNARIRAIGVAWWTDGRGNKHVVFCGDCSRNRDLDRFPDSTNCLALVFRDLNVLKSAASCNHAFNSLPYEFQAAIRANHADPLVWLVAADWLDENGHDATPIRAFFGEPVLTPAP